MTALLTPRFSPVAVAIIALLAASAGWWLGRESGFAAAGAAETAKPQSEHTIAAKNGPPVGSTTTASLATPSTTKAQTAAAIRSRAQAIEELAARDPQQAIALMGAEKNLFLQRTLRDAILRGWASRSPDEALAWAMTFRDADNRTAIEAVLTGAAQRPADAVRLAAQLCERYPPLAEDYGNAVINALATHGEFEAAATFAARGKSEHQPRWLNTAFAQWAQLDPSRALAVGREIVDPSAREHALEGVYSGWAQADPAGLATRALEFPDERDRTTALNHALSQWLQYDPGSASRWLDRMAPRPELDSGMLTLATLPTLIQRRPEVAAEWARSITDVNKRADALRTIAHQWAQIDAAGAQRFASGPAGLSAEEQHAWNDGIRDAVQPPDTGTERTVPASGDPR